ncbi:hypothetical protein BJV82DRAFT_660476 [Fennellomyces sp. T-0311]|nr:hypothetical protein BJV82DRAFT_660476 [Fennellomyces sp. T-0311]
MQHLVPDAEKMKTAVASRSYESLDISNQHQSPIMTSMCRGKFLKHSQERDGLVMSRHFVVFELYFGNTGAPSGTFQRAVRELVDWIHYSIRHNPSYLASCGHFICHSIVSELSKEMESTTSSNGRNSGRINGVEVLPRNAYQTAPLLQESPKKHH